MNKHILTGDHTPAFGGGAWHAAHCGFRLTSKEVKRYGVAREEADCEVCCGEYDRKKAPVTPRFGRT